MSDTPLVPSAKLSALGRSLAVAIRRKGQDAAHQATKRAISRDGKVMLDRGDAVGGKLPPGGGGTGHGQGAEPPLGTPSEDQSILIRDTDGTTAWTVLLERIQDIIGAMIATAGGSYDDVAGTINLGIVYQFAIREIDGSPSDSWLELEMPNGTLTDQGGGRVRYTPSGGGGSGDVVGPSSSVASEIALFDGTTGKLLKRATGTGIASLASGVLSASTAPAFTDFTNANHDHGDADDGGTLTHAAISDFDTQVRTNRLDQLAAPTANVSMASHKITNVTNPTSAQDAATKAYADSVGVGSTSIGSGVLSGRASPGNAGSLFFPTDAPVMYRDDGTAWQPFGPLFRFVEPSDTGFAWVNQGDASLDTAHGGLTIVAPANAALNVRARVKTAPATPYTIVGVLLLPPIVQTTGGYECGLTFRQSSDGKLHTLSVEPAANGAWNVKSNKFTSPTVFSATYATFGAAGLLWLRIADNGTNRICSISADGRNWLQIHTVGRTDFLTADQVGFWARAAATTGSVATLLSWEQS